MVISKTPLRASLFGGGTDFKDYWANSRMGYGTVLSAALDMHVYITVNKKFDDKIRVVYSGNELVDSVDEVKHNIIREALKITGISKGIEVIYMADIPLSGAGVGLASSSALAVGVLNALHAYKGEYVTPEILAKEACEIEINRLGQQIGIQDQYAVAYGGFHQYRFYPNGKVSVNPVIGEHNVIETVENNLLMFFTGQTRDSRQILKEQSSTIVDKSGMLDELVEITNRIYSEAFRADRIHMIGERLDYAWQIKKKFATGVSNEVIDEMYFKAKKAGALGGKVLGAGGGGFLLFYVPEENQDSVREALKDYREVTFKIDPQGSNIIFSD
ncbi:GHMP family kinase ATP-binding protein [Pseudobutyrivibrio sp.]